VNGTLDEGNIQAGVTISFYSDNNTVGGTTEAARNIISGNDNYGVWISGNNTDANTVIGNYIGTQVNGTTALANGNGVFLSTSTKNNTIGGTSAGARNIISGNTNYGVKIQNTGTNNNTVCGNYIGTDKNGTADLGNASIGVYICVGAQNNTVGGTSSGAGNVISGNNTSGVYISENNTTGNQVQGNYIGTDIKTEPPIWEIRLPVFVSPVALRITQLEVLQQHPEILYQAMIIVAFM